LFSDDHQCYRCNLLHYIVSGPQIVFKNEFYPKINNRKTLFLKALQSKAKNAAPNINCLGVEQ